MFLPFYSENKPKKGGICVANHTSPIDVIILASDGCYAMVGQIHGGLMGLFRDLWSRPARTFGSNAQKSKTDI
ncbi:hypothetical protein F7725_012542 [Dissostichus mawsoni]|uniref:Phospholipid/glycerol acyltransferase domain-containing protein n=1 Tax=Dissostichus mawsoni TaxID=36200 RepID=A0A7J5YN03_DISMA|nr:hypothetical protein F7725_012542 [Dissostichus mawsoni]